MRNWFVLAFIIITLSLTAKGNVDPFNTYQWNRPDNQTLKSNAPWYEWWYYKIVIPETNESFFFVYGVVNPWDYEGTLKGTHSYVEMGDFQAKTTTKSRFNVDQFEAAYDRTHIVIGDNNATDKMVRGQIFNEEGESFAWNFEMENRWTFNPAGWGTGRNLTNIEWYSAQADAYCSGEILSGGKHYKFEDAPCYQDRNWGKSFPEWWTWIVSNNFEDHPETALSIGGGKPVLLNMPWLNIKGVGIGLRHEGVVYEWRPNDFDSIKMDVNFGKWEVVGKSRDYKIEVSAFAPKESFMDLQFITPLGEVFHDYETLTGDVVVKLYKRVKRGGPFSRKRWELIANLKSKHTGIEYGSSRPYSLSKIFKTKNIKLQ